jgi:hypothetical protein
MKAACNGAKRTWFQELAEINAKHSLGINFKAWEASKDLKHMKNLRSGTWQCSKTNKMLDATQTSVHTTNGTKDKL